MVPSTFYCSIGRVYILKEMVHRIWAPACNYAVVLGYINGRHNDFFLASFSQFEFKGRSDKLFLPCENKGWCLLAPEERLERQRWLSLTTVSLLGINTCFWGPCWAWQYESSPLGAFFPPLFFFAARHGPFFFLISTTRREPLVHSSQPVQHSFCIKYNFKTDLTWL